ncbi:MAG: hypothetical protein HYY78_12215 [Betaproteobacteria bacterium]|nr:hypothetical protein [Betaproteobacteria bacterium]
MNRDLIINVVVGVDAKLRRIERLALSIGDPQQHKSRIPPLITDVRRELQSLCGRLAQLEGGE